MSNRKPMPPRITMQQKLQINEMFEANLYSVGDIAEHLSLSYHQVYLYYKKINPNAISRQTNGKSPKAKQAYVTKIKITDEQQEMLYDLYVTQDKPVREISKIMNITDATTCAALRRFNIPVKRKSGTYDEYQPLFGKEQLTTLYWELGKSLQEISDLLGYVNHGQVYYDFKMQNIPLRTYKEAGKLLYIKHPEKREIHRQHFYIRIQKGMYDSPPTWIERKFMDWAKLNNIRFTEQFQFSPFTHRYDFHLIGTNILVEMDGTIWHASDKHKAKDLQFDKEAIEKDFIVIRIPEAKISKHQNNFDIFNEVLLPMLNDLNTHEEKTYEPNDV